MKKYFLLVIALCLVLSCQENSDEPKVEATSDVIELENYNNSGVNFCLEGVGQTRTGVSDMYYLKAEMPSDNLILEGIVTVESDTQGNRQVNLYRTGDELPDDIFIGSYTVDEALRIVDVTVGDDGFAYDVTKRLPGEGNWACIRREYQLMKKAYEERVLDDIVCDIVAPACKVLALIAATVECDK